jgi:hypothetical protein
VAAKIAIAVVRIFDDRDMHALLRCLVRSSARIQPVRRIGRNRNGTMVTAFDRSDVGA